VAIGKRSTLQRHLRTLFGLGTVRDLTDGQILERFATAHREVADLAFTALVERHGPMVLRVCRSVLSDPHEAEDAFQATFLVLLEKARGLWVRDSLGPWLFQVAHRTASCSRSASTRRRRHERHAARTTAVSLAGDGAAIDREAGRMLHEEIGRLPERYRAPIVLCDLQGQTCEEAARSMGCPVGTLKCWRARGRERLRSRLIRRGLNPSDVLLGLLPPAEMASRVLVNSTVGAAVRLAKDGGSVGAVSAAVAALARGVVRTLFLERLWTLSLAASVLIALSVGLGAVTQAEKSAGQAPARAGAPPSKPVGKSIRQILQEAAQMAQAAPDAASRTYALVEIAKARARAGDKEGAVQSARQAAAAALTLDPKGQGWALPAVAWARAAAGDREGALNVLLLAKKSAAGIGSVGERMVVVQIVARSQADLGGRDAAMATIQGMSETALAVPARGTERVACLKEVVSALAYAGDFDAAFRFVDAAGADGHHAQGQLLGAMASAAASDSAFYLGPRKSIGPEEGKARLRVLERIVGMVEPFEFAEEKPYFELTIASARLGDVEGALRLARRFGKGPMKYPHTIDQTATPLILAAIGSYQGKGGHLERARETFREALDLIRRDPKLSMRLGQVAWGQGTAGDLAGALKTLEAVDSRQRIQELTEIADQRQETGDREGARASLRAALAEAEFLRREPDAQSKDDDLARLTALRAKLGDLPAAVEAFRSITQENERGWAARDIAEARARAGDAEGALAWALTLEPPTVRVWALRGLAMGARPR
jgi:RNA polymerase sigma factor (sigma-70 family)